MTHEEVIKHSRKVLKRPGKRWKSSVTSLPDIDKFIEKYSDYVERKKNIVQLIP